MRSGIAGILKSYQKQHFCYVWQYYVSGKVTRVVRYLHIYDPDSTEWLRENANVAKIQTLT